MFRREMPTKRDRTAPRPSPKRTEAPYAPPGESASRERRRRSFWAEVAVTTLIARLF